MVYGIAVDGKYQIPDTGSRLPVGVTGNSLMTGGWSGSRICLYRLAGAWMVAFGKVVFVWFWCPAGSVI
jgi:hypothetical protein